MEAVVAQETQGQVTPETKTPAPEAPKPQEDDSITKKFAALSRRERLIKQENDRIKAERAKHEAELAEYRKWKEEQSKPRQKKNPIEVLQEYGFTYEDAASYYLDKDKFEAESRLKSLDEKINNVEKTLTEKEQQRLDEEKAELEAQAQEAVKTVHGQIKGFITSKPDDYELINLLGADEFVPQIYELIELHFEKTQKLLTYKEAADQFESILEEKAKAVTQAKKLKKHMEPEKKDAPTTTTKTLTNQDTTAPASPGVEKSEEERIRRALALLN